jgi:hypothetical protein
MKSISLVNWAWVIGLRLPNLAIGGEVTSVDKAEASFRQSSVNISESSAHPACE